MQPYIFPNLNYIRLICSDYFIVLDDVNFIKRGFINRNSMSLTQSNSQRFVLPISKISQNRHINKHYYLGSFEDLYAHCERFCSKDPFYSDAIQILKNWSAEIDKKNTLNVSEINITSLESVIDYLNLGKKIHLSSVIDSNPVLKRQDRIVRLCNIHNANIYINAAGGANLYDVEHFSKHGIELRFQHKFRSDEQPNEFVSILKVISMFGREAVIKILKQ